MRAFGIDRASFDFDEFGNGQYAGREERRTLTFPGIIPYPLFVYIR